MLSFNVAFLSEQGGRKINEDACGHWASEHQLCCVLADGAGGHGGGDIASRLAVTRMLTEFSRSPTSGSRALVALVRHVNQAILDEREPLGPRKDMHTTIVSLVIDMKNESAEWAYCGDSRLYWFRGTRLLERTRDHSYVQALLDAGAIQENQIRSQPNRSMLCSALGQGQDELIVTASPHARILSSGDVFLLCSDGVWEYLTDEVLESSLQQAGSACEWLAVLGDLVKSAALGRPSHDNYSAIAVWVV